MGVAVLSIAGLAVSAFAQPRLPTTRKDFYLYGTQPSTPDEVEFEFLREADVCAACHGDYTESQSPYERWRYTMMSQSFRDPVFHAALQVANKDAAFAGDFCLRCHAPMGWFQGRVTDPDGSSLDPLDHEGVSCSICHRAVDPDYKPGISPTVDEEVLEALGFDRPPETGMGGPLANSHLVIDKLDRRRGPFDLGEFFYHQFLQSNLHVSSDMCAGCHDVSNPAYTKVTGPGGEPVYVGGSFDTKHPTGNKYDMFPVERLYSEWKQSAFAAGAVTQTVPDGNGGFVGRFGGHNVTSYSTCQDCHMPPVEGTGCAPFLGSPVRPNVPQHNFAGANTWVLRSINDLFSPLETRMDDPAQIDASIGRASTMLQRASDTELLVVGDQLRVRVINEGGHKLPSGYSEGRRMWVNVKFFNAANVQIAERGAYNNATGTLVTADTKVYEQLLGLDAAAAAATGLPAGESFHFALNNVVLKDNRIPPRGFTNAGFAAVQAAPIEATYADGQYWDDTLYTIPAGTASVQVRVFHQTSTKEYIEFLRDNANDPIQGSDFIQPPAGSTATTLGEIVHEQWVRWGRSAPTMMDSVATPARACKPDLGGTGAALGADGALNNNDFIVFIDLFFAHSPIADFGSTGGVAGPDGEFNNNDFVVFIDAFFGACP
ncbi:MAG TPA: GC-type dockerin domain-anchored protein [Phycisphaerales bacterium]|nr:GC-type dockerin domain-anchored protein [Phycisphaerales bacterium]